MAILPLLQLQIQHSDVPKFYVDEIEDACTPYWSNDDVTVARIRRPPSAPTLGLHCLEITFKAKSDACAVASYLLGAIPFELLTDGPDADLLRLEQKPLEMTITRISEPYVPTVIALTPQFMIAQVNFRNSDIIILRFEPTAHTADYISDVWMLHLSHTLNRFGRITLQNLRRANWFTEGDSAGAYTPTL